MTTAEKLDLKELKVGDKAPDFDLAINGGGRVKLADLKGKKVVLYFYPKDDTPGCTVESKDFGCLHGEFEKKGAVVLGISKDSVKSHDKFKAKFDLPFDLLSDETTDINQAYGVWKQKSFMGKKFMGTERTTFLIGKDGKIERIWPKVDVKGHAEEVLKAI